jgi:gas vesicle protein
VKDTEKIDQQTDPNSNRNTSTVYVKEGQRLRKASGKKLSEIKEWIALTLRRVADRAASVSVEEVIQACSQELESQVQDFRNDNPNANAKAVMEHLAAIYGMQSEGRDYFSELTQLRREPGQALALWHAKLTGFKGIWQMNSPETYTEAHVITQFCTGLGPPELKANVVTIHRTPATRFASLAEALNCAYREEERMEMKESTSTEQLNALRGNSYQSHHYPQQRSGPNGYQAGLPHPQVRPVGPQIQIPRSPSTPPDMTTRIPRQPCRWYMTPEGCRYGDRCYGFHPGCEHCGNKDHNTRQHEEFKRLETEKNEEKKE